MGCAVCTGITTLLTKGIIINWYYAKKIKLGIGRFWQNILGLLLKLSPTVLVGIAINIFIPHVTWLWLIFKIGLYTLVFGVYALLVCMNKEEKGLATELLQKIRRKG